MTNFIDLIEEQCQELVELKPIEQEKFINATMNVMSYCGVGARYLDPENFSFPKPETEHLVFENVWHSTRIFVGGHMKQQMLSYIQGVRELKSLRITILRIC